MDKEKFEKAVECMAVINLNTHKIESMDLVLNRNYDNELVLIENVLDFLPKESKKRLSEMAKGLLSEYRGHLSNEIEEAQQRFERL
jgi:hypothetical protein